MLAGDEDLRRPDDSSSDLRAASRASRSAADVSDSPGTTVMGDEDVNFAKAVNEALRASRQAERDARDPAKSPKPALERAAVWSQLALAFTLQDLMAYDHFERKDEA